jgi:hypothetical protein
MDVDAPERRRAEKRVKDFLAEIDDEDGLWGGCEKPFLQLHILVDTGRTVNFESLLGRKNFDRGYPFMESSSGTAGRIRNDKLGRIAPTEFFKAGGAESSGTHEPDGLRHITTPYGPVEASF